MNFEVTDTSELKIINSESFHVIFNKGVKTFIMWGDTVKEQPVWCPYGPLVAHIHISTKTLNYIRLILENLCSTKTLCLLIIDNHVSDDMFKDLQTICHEYGVECMKQTSTKQEEDWSTFVLYVNKNGSILPEPDSKEEIKLEDINNFVKDVWYSYVFKQVRYEKIRREQK